MATESFKSAVSRQLSQLVEYGDPSRIEFGTSLSSEERKYIHRMAQEFGLVSRSQGKGNLRFVVVARSDSEYSDYMMSKEYDDMCFLGKVRNRDEIVRVSEEPIQIKLEYNVMFQRIAEKSRYSQPTGKVSEVVKRRKATDNLFEQASFDASDLEFRREKYIPDADYWETVCKARLEKDLYRDVVYPHRCQLPAFANRDDLLCMLADSKVRVTLITGPTGSGKSTQIPQLILDSIKDSRIVVTQPRRIAAIALASRVAEERCECLGQTCGFRVHMDSGTDTSTRSCRLTFCTNGILKNHLTRLASAKNPKEFADILQRDPVSMKDVTHIILDELHERDKVSDFLLILLRDLIQILPHLRVVLMSATMNIECFEEYLRDSGVEINKFTIEGRNFEVHEMFLDEIFKALWRQPVYRGMLGPAMDYSHLDVDEKEFKMKFFRNELGSSGTGEKTLTKERLSRALEFHDVLQQAKGLSYDYSLIECLMCYINQSFLQSTQEGASEQPGTILIFLPGWEEIQKCRFQLTENLDETRFVVLVLHSQIRIDEQQLIFQKFPGKRKVILATNIAETSITVSDVEFVIDSGRSKERVYDAYRTSNGVSTLSTVWISKSSMRQRAGRAGRTKTGLCFHLFSRQRSKVLDDFRTPEMLRSPLEDLCLETMIYRMPSITSFLAKALNPPDSRQIANALTNLENLGALRDPDPQAFGKPELDQLEFTELGKHLAFMLPLAPIWSKTVLWSILLGCLDDVVLLIANTSHKDPFEGLPQKRASQSLIRDLKLRFCEKKSDHVSYLRCCQSFQEAEKQRRLPEFCQQNGNLSTRRMQQILDNQTRVSRELSRLKSLGCSSLITFGNRNRGDENLLRACLTAGMFPNLALKREVSSKFKIFGKDIEALPYSHSVFARFQNETEHTTKEDCLVIFQELILIDNRFTINHVTEINPLYVVLFSGRFEDCRVEGSLLRLQELTFQCESPFQAQQLFSLRRSLLQAMENFSRSLPEVNFQDFILVHDTIEMLKSKVQIHEFPESFQQRFVQPLMQNPRIPPPPPPLQRPPPPTGSHHPTGFQKPQFQDLSSLDDFLMKPQESQKRPLESVDEDLEKRPN